MLAGDNKKMSDKKLFIKNVELKEYNDSKFPHITGLDEKHRRGENGENLLSLMGTKAQINSYLQTAAKDIISERCRTLNDLPKYRIINTTVKRIW